MLLPCFSNHDSITVTTYALTDIGLTEPLTEDLSQTLVVRAGGVEVGTVNFIYKPNPNITEVSPLTGIQA